MINKAEAEITASWSGDWDKPMVSVRCLCYNHEAYIAQCLDGFLAQETTFPFEIIVHDDCSTDRSAAIIREYEERFPHIVKPIYETENQYSKKDGSLSQILNNACKGKYIAFCEGDDYWINPKKIQLQFESLERNPDCNISFTKVQFILRNGEIRNYTAPSKKKFKKEIVTIEDYVNEEYKAPGHWCFHTSSFFLRKSIYQEYLRQRFEGGFCKFPYGDMAVITYFLTHGNGTYIPEISSCYRLDSGGYNTYTSTHHEFAKEQDRKLIDALEFFDEYTEYKYTSQIRDRIYRVKVSISRHYEDKRRLVNLKQDRLMYYRNRGKILTLIKGFISSRFPFTLKVNKYIRQRLIHR